MCFQKDQNNLEKLLARGWCLSCFLQREMSPSEPMRNDAEVQGFYSGILEMDPYDKYTEVKLIGRGGSSQVYLVTDKTTSECFAMKAISARGVDPKKIHKEFLQSFQVQSKNIIKTYELYSYMNMFYIIEELMKTSLDKLVKKKLSEIEIAFILREVLKGLKYIHSQNQIHRDIKSDNIFLGNDGTVKIGDFGETVELTVERDARDTIVGSSYWMSPEVCNGEKYTVSSDIWSFGIVIYELTNGHPPYRNLSSLQISEAIMEDPIPEINPKLSEKLKNLSRSCLQKNPIFRKSSHQLLLLPYLQKVNDNVQTLIMNKYLQ